MDRVGGPRLARPARRRSSATRPPARRSSRTGCPAGRGRRRARRGPLRRNTSASVRTVVVLPVPPFCERTAIVSATPGSPYCVRDRDAVSFAARTRRAPARRRRGTPRNRRWHPPAARPVPACTTRPMSTTPAVSPSWRASARPLRMRSSRVPCGRSSTSSTAAPRGRTRTLATAPASWSSCPTSFLRDEVPFELPEPGRYGVGVCFLPERRVRPRARRAPDRRDRRGRGPDGARLARRARRPSALRHHGRAPRPVHPPAVRRRRRRRRGPGRARAPPLRDPPGRRARRAAQPGDREHVEQDASSTRGCSPPRSCPSTSPT